VEDLRDARPDIEDARRVPEDLRLPLELDAAGRSVGTSRVVRGERPRGETRETDERQEERVRDVAGEEGLELLGRLEEQRLRLGVLGGLATEIPVVVDLEEENKVADRVLYLLAGRNSGEAGRPRSGRTG
jgi:hypothetical protein